MTIEELDEIFREQYPLETEGKTMNRYLKKAYGSVSNRNLINYKQLKNKPTLLQKHRSRILQTS